MEFVEPLLLIPNAVASKVGFVIDVAGRAQMDSTPDSMRNNLVGPDGAGGKVRARNHKKISAKRIFFAEEGTA